MLKKSIDGDDKEVNGEENLKQGPDKVKKKKHSKEILGKIIDPFHLGKKFKKFKNNIGEISSINLNKFNTISKSEIDTFQENAHNILRIADNLLDGKIVIFQKFTDDAESAFKLLEKTKALAKNEKDFELYDMYAQYLMERITATDNFLQDLGKDINESLKNAAIKILHAAKGIVEVIDGAVEIAKEVVETTDEVFDGEVVDSALNITKKVVNVVDEAVDLTKQTLDQAEEDFKVDEPFNFKKSDIELEQKFLMIRAKTVENEENGNDLTTSAKILSEIIFLKKNLENEMKLLLKEKEKEEVEQKKIDKQDAKKLKKEMKLKKKEEAAQKKIDKQNAKKLKKEMKKDKKEKEVIKDQTLEVNLDNEEDPQVLQNEMDKLNEELKKLQEKDKKINIPQPPMLNGLNNHKKKKEKKLGEEKTKEEVQEKIEEKVDASKLKNI